MAKTPWRCSQCGTINEPAANSCRTCGRWPSLFDLQDSTVGDVDTAEDELEHGRWRYEHEDAVESYEPEYAAESYEPDASDPSAFPPAPGEPVEPRAQPGGRGAGTRRLVRLVIPIGVLLYFLISSYFSNR